MRSLPVVLAGAAAATLIGVSFAGATGSYDGSYAGTLAYTAQVPGEGAASGTATIGFSVTNGALAGSFGPVPQYGTVSFSGSVSSSGSGSAAASYGCVVSWSIASSGGVTGSVSGCTDQGGTASGSHTASRTSAPPPATTTTTTTTTPPSGGFPPVVSELTGRVRLRHADGSTAPIGSSTPIAEGDEVITAAGSRVVLEFSDGSKVEIGPNASFTLEMQSPQSTTIKQVLGQIIYSIAKGLGGRRFQVRTPTACACVRGTRFSVETRPGWTRTRVFEGTVDFYNPKVPKKHVFVKAGFESAISGSKAPTRTKRF